MTLSAGLAACSHAESISSSRPELFLVCSRGEGQFQGHLPDFSVRSGVTVRVGPARHEGFAAHGCQASLSWRGGTTSLGTGLEQIDVDVMGADLGWGVPVVAFQTKAAADPRIRYEIYSLDRPPRLLRTLVNEDYFRAVDTRMDGTVEIWTTDAMAVDGFDGLPRAVFEEPPAVVLRVEHGRLLDVGPEYRTDFDRQIARLRAQITPRDAADFEASDGRLATGHIAPGHPGGGAGGPDRLLATKIRVLELAWAYLQSGRPAEAWAALDPMWPASDRARVRAAIEQARRHGLAGQVDGVTDRIAPPGAPDSVYIYDRTLGFGMTQDAAHRGGFADTAPEQILVRLPSPPDPARWDDQRGLELVIDQAGKVHSARLPGGLLRRVLAGVAGEDEGDPVEDWLEMAGGWKYIPAYKDGHPQAFRDHLRVLRDR